jgi:dipeptidyl aminopeptidase/acylaminoacyl peptidase
MSQREIPCGAWPSPVSAELAASAARRLSQPQLDGAHVYWLEGRPAEGGRQTVVRARLDGAGGAEEVTPGRNVRCLVHEYGGGDYRAFRGAVFCADPEGGAFAVDAAAGPAAGARPLASARPGARYGDFAASPDGRFLAAVEEEHGEGEPRNRLVALALEGSERIVVADGFDFVSSPCFSPDGSRLAFLTWERPDMPWDATTLRVVAWGGSGPKSPPRAVAGGGEESIFQPSFSPRGVLTFVSDRSGFWNLYQERGGRAVALHRAEVEFGLPQWVLGMSTYAHEAEGALLCSVRSGGRDRLCRLHVEAGELDDLGAPYDVVTGVTAALGSAAFVGAGPRRSAAVCALDLASARLREVRAAFELDLEPAFLSTPEKVELESEEGRRAHAFLYLPSNPGARPPAGERPPLLVLSHGGPTSAASPALRLALQYWTTRGFAAIDVDYAGSAGYGRAYRNLLRAAWGVRDVADCAAAARFAAAQGAADARRLLASGGSAGGYTTLCLLTFRDEFAAGASHYGIGDLEALARDTHKFESRYLERLVGPWPARADLYRARSPLRCADRLARPVIFFQGLDDKVVPPAQAEAMAGALAARGVPHAYVAFPGEAHGFRRAETLRTALASELWFYGRVLGFDAGPAPEGVRLAAAPHPLAATRRP